MRHFNRNTLSLALVSALALGSNLAMAAGGPDYGSILDGLDAGDAVTAFIAAATILALVGFGKWISKKVGKYFG
jgi:hypothetical protein